MASLLRRRSLPRQAIELLEPRIIGRDVRAVRGKVELRRTLARSGALVARLIALVTLDVSGIAIAIYSGLVVKELAAGRPVFWGLAWRAESAWLPFITLVVVLVFARSHLYGPRGERPGGPAIVSSLALSALVVAVFALATGHRYQTFSIYFWTFAGSAVLVPTLRASFDVVTWSVAHALGQRRRLVVCGSDDDAAAIAEALEESHSGGVEVVAVVAAPGDIAAAVAEHEPQDVILAHAPDDAVLLDALEVCDAADVRLRIVPTAARLLARETVYVPGQAVPLFEVRPPTLSGVDWLAKRAFDLVVALCTLIVLAPLLAVIAISVKLTSRGPVLYRDERVGIGERPFAMLKFRSMRLGADREQALLEAANEADGAIFKIRRDPRLTPVGRLLRRLSLDELPQLVNVLRGEMSLIGPRPLPMRDYARLEPWHRKRYLVLPGITGLWQISGRSNLGFDDMVRLDFFYLEHWSVWLDVTILARTPAAVLSGRGAF